MAKDKISFKSQSKDTFLSDVRAAAENYFAQKNLPKTAGVTLYVKTLLIAAASVSLYSILLFGLFPVIPRIIVWIVLGLVQMLLAVNVGHDALHGSFSNREWINRLLGYWAYDCTGMSSYVWKQTHNREHHTFTNIAGVDPDIHKPGILRLSPHDPYFKIHRFQHLYVWLLYAFVSLNWVYPSDFSYFWTHRKEIPPAERAPFLFLKAFHIFLYIGVMLLWSPMSWSQVLLGYLAMHCAGGIFAAIVFQLAHVVENVAFPLPDAEGVIHASWGAHEMTTTSNFAIDSFWVTHLVGGLNFQVEHHLLPKISHCHYPALSKIVQETAKRYQLPYHQQPTLYAAVASHVRLLRSLGQR